jgi:putative toxin-antitoxin system antitoxin component (TIGR02293 family)
MAYNCCQVAAMVTAARVIETLGGARALRRRPSNFESLHEELRKGLPYAALEAVATRFELSREDLSAVLALPARTLARRKAEHRLTGNESDRLFRFGRIAAFAEDVLGSREKASRWLHAPNRALGNQAPLRHLDTDLGSRRVEDLLLRIAHGVYS